MKLSYQIIALAAIVTACKAYPKFETEDKGFVPSKGDYFHDNGDQLAMESKPANHTITDVAQENRPARYGFPTYSTDVQSYPQNVNNVVPGVYGPVKLDIGGLVLGTIVGLGAFFILPSCSEVNRESSLFPTENVTSLRKLNDSQSQPNPRTSS